jgi:ectoine hydroxylase-related dioxygenase (phytanoyl-CoA dioxygenase family)
VRTHRWNRGFEWTDHQGPHRFLTDEQVRQYDERGFFVLEDAFTEDELAPVRDELDRYEAKVGRWLDREGVERVSITEKGAIIFAPNLTARSEVLAGFVRHPVYLGIAADLLGPDVNLYWEQAVYKKPEKPRRFPWHQDTGYKVTEPQDYLTCWTALTDATVDNGCPVVAPGLHRHGTLHHDFVDPLGWECFESPPDGTAPAPAPVKAGGIVVFSSLTPHMTGPNTTGADRKAYIVQYARAGTTGAEGDPRSEPQWVAQDDPSFQFPVLREGEPVSG